MQKLLVVLALLMPVAAMAGNTANANSGATAVSNSGANSNASQGNSQGVTINSRTPDSLRTVPDVVAPGLVASYVECFGSTSGGVAAMGFGISLGTTHTDADCQHRRDANSAVALGEVAVGYQVMCQNLAFYKADQATKKQCAVMPDGYAPPPVVNPQAKADTKVKDKAEADKPIEPVAFLQH